MFSGKADCDDDTQLRKFACLRNSRAKGHLCPFNRDNIARQAKEEKELVCSIKKNNIGSRPAEVAGTRERRSSIAEDLHR